MAEPASGSRFVFVLGTGRCGSTLLHEVLARHGHAGFVSNVEDNLPQLDLGGRWNALLYRRVPPSLTRKGRLRYAPSEAYRLLDQQVSPIVSTPFRDLTADDVTPWLEDRFRKFFEGRAARQGLPVFLHKFTGWPRVGFIRRIFPDARFIHVIRDGRAVANSWLQMPWWLGHRGPEAWQWGPLPEDYGAEWEASGRSFVLLAGLAWKILMDAFEEVSPPVPGDDWLDVRYEDVMAEPRRHVEAMLRFAGLEWTDDFATSFGQYEFSRGRSQAFRRDLDEASLSLLDGSLAGHLSRYGYES